MRAVFSDAAVEDLESIERYILSYRDEPFLERFEEGLAALVRSIAERPWSRPVYQFPPGAEPTMEYRSANTYNYKVFYRVDEQRWEHRRSGIFRQILQQMKNIRKS